MWQVLSLSCTALECSRRWGNGISAIAAVSMAFPGEYRRSQPSRGCTDCSTTIPSSCNTWVSQHSLRHCGTTLDNLEVSWVPKHWRKRYPKAGHRSISLLSRNSSDEVELFWSPKWSMSQEAPSGLDVSVNLSNISYYSGTSCLTSSFSLYLTPFFLF